MVVNFKMGDEYMKGIIIYSTKYGSVEKAAKILQSKLNIETSLVNVMKEKVPSLEEFDIVMLGGSIYVGRVQKQLTKYINEHLEELMNKKVGLFICAGQEAEVQKVLENAYPKDLYNHADAKETFGYEYNFEKASFIDKFILRKMAGVTSSVSNINSEKIEAFAKQMSYN